MVSYDPSLNQYLRPKKGSAYIYKRYQFSFFFTVASFRWYFRSYWLYTPKGVRSFVKWNHFYFVLIGTACYLVNVLIGSFLDHTLGSNYYLRRGCPCGVMVKAMDCGIVEREFVLQSRYYVHFRANTLGKGMNPLILPAMG